MLQTVRPPLQDRRAAAGRSAEALPRRAKIQPGLCHGGVRLLRADRPRIPLPAGLSRRRRARPSSARSSTRSACRRRSRCATGRTQFGHIFSGDHYASGYYSYMWSEVMDADAFGAFEEAGNIFDPAVAKRLHDDIYSSGGSRDPEEAYIAFRGRKPEPDALLRRRGLLDAPRRPEVRPLMTPDCAACLAAACRRCCARRRRRRRRIRTSGSPRPASWSTRPTARSRHPPRLELRRHVLDLRAAGHRDQDQGRLHPRGAGAAGADQCRIR